MELGRKPQRMGWRNGKNHREWDGGRKRTTEKEMEVDREPRRRRCRNRITENAMEVGKEKQRIRWK